MDTTYYIFRHGDTFATKRPGLIRLGAFSYGAKVFSAPILEEAKPAVKRIGMFLKDKDIEFAVSSPFIRCVQTAEIVANETKVPFVYDRRLKEFFLETYGSLTKRLTSLLQEIEENQYKSVAICTHAAVIATLISILSAKKNKPSGFALFQYPMSGVLTVIKRNRVEEISFNE